MREEQVTKAILKWLHAFGWEIVCFDFPQSGTGRFLHPNANVSDKNLASINPDIVAVKERKCVFFENKDRFYYPDYEKVHDIKVTQNYSQDTAKLLSDRPIDIFYYGIGLPSEKHGKKSKDASYLVDFIVGVEPNASISVLHAIDDSIFE